VELLNVYNNIIWAIRQRQRRGCLARRHGPAESFLYNDVNNMYGVWDIAQNLLNVDPMFFDPVNGIIISSSPRPAQTRAPMARRPCLSRTSTAMRALTARTGRFGLLRIQYQRDASGGYERRVRHHRRRIQRYAAAWKAGQTDQRANVRAKPNSDPGELPHSRRLSIEQRRRVYK